MNLPPELLGPLGLTVMLLLIAGALWREHIRADADDRRQRDLAMAALQDSINANRELAHAWDERNRADAERARRS